MGRECLSLIIGSILILSMGCDKATKEPTAAVIRPVKLYQVTNPLQEQLRYFPGMVAATEEVEISFRIPGHLNSLLVKNGDEVVKGQALAYLDDRDFRNELQDRLASFELQQNEFERANSLNVKNIISKSDFDSAKARLKSSKAALELAKDKLEYSISLAPFSGRIAKTLVNNHQEVRAQQALLVLQSRAMLDIRIQMPESIISHITKESVKTGYNPVVTFPGVEGVNFPIFYKEHSTLITPGTQSYEVVFSLPAPAELNILPGMSATVILDLSMIMSNQLPKGVVIPLSAIEKNDESNQVVAWLFEDKTSEVKSVQVKVGEVTATGVHILSGIIPGDMIVVAGSGQLVDGMKVKPLRMERGL